MESLKENWEGGNGWISEEHVDSCGILFYRSERTFFFFPCGCSEVLLLLEEGCASVLVSQYLIYCLHLLTVFVLKSKECFC